MWKFDVLAVPKLKEIAAKDATAAEIIIVSAHDGRQLPAEVKGWLEVGLSYKTESSALVGLFGGESTKSGAQYFAEVARRAKIEFFCQPGIWPGAAEHAQHQSWRNRTKKRLPFSPMSPRTARFFALGNQRIIYGPNTKKQRSGSFQKCDFPGTKIHVGK